MDNELNSLLSIEMWVYDVNYGNNANYDWNVFFLVKDYVNYNYVILWVYDINYGNNSNYDWALLESMNYDWVRV